MYLDTPQGSSIKNRWKKEKTQGLNDDEGNIIINSVGPIPGLFVRVFLCLCRDVSSHGRFDLIRFDLIFFFSFFLALVLLTVGQENKLICHGQGTFLLGHKTKTKSNIKDRNSSFRVQDKCFVKMSIKYFRILIILRCQYCLCICQYCHLPLLLPFCPSILSVYFTVLFLFARADPELSSGCHY
ncbi:hypothetical protein F4703DRAFT_1788310 [Phycomyces blakesleeanus]